MGRFCRGGGGGDGGRGGGGAGCDALVLLGAWRSVEER